MRRNLLFLIFISLVLPMAVSGQEKLFDLSCNGVISDMKKVPKNQLKSSTPLPPFSNPYVVLTMPFIDDFSYDGPYPDSARWIDNNVFINPTYPVCPVNIGVATFDGINKNGYPYDFTAAPTVSAGCDTLTSKRIKMNGLTDSVYFSFFYQAQGRGNQPEPEDSLVLEFRGSRDSTWRWVWSHAGYALTPPDTGFHLVMIPVMDTLYYNKSWFQFRFRNYATPSGNLDHWHVDYIKLDHSRTFTDTLPPPLAFVYEPLSMLAKYQAMPWKQYSPSEMASNVGITIRNNTTSAQNMTYMYQGSHYGVPFSTAWSAVDPGLAPFSSGGYSTYAPCADPPVSGNNFSYGPSLTDTTMFVINHILYENVVNKDTVRYRQRFYNYYAYDDGSAELGYGIAGANTIGAQLAVKFSTNVKDTIRAVQIYWNPILLDVSSRTFRMCVWAAAGNGQPGTLLYQSDSIYSPRYMPGYNHFHTYKLDTILPILGTFFVGYTQFTEDNLSVGFDQNTNNQNNNYYKTTGGWNTSIYPGSLMIRPLFGDTIRMTGIHENVSEANAVNIFPNPAQDQLHIKVAQPDGMEKYHVSLFDMYGKLLFEHWIYGNETLDVSNLPNGFYLVRIAQTGKSSYTRKLLITR